MKQKEINESSIVSDEETCEHCGGTGIFSGMGLNSEGEYTDWERKCVCKTEDEFDADDDSGMYDDDFDDEDFIVESDEQPNW